MCSPSCGSVTATETDLVGVQPNATLSIMVFYDFVGETLVMEPLDGGSMVGGNSAVVSTLGSASFSFQAGPNPGISQLRVTDSDGGYEIMVVQLWVFDPTDPGNNPPVINN
jgi:hypothetical protein